MSNIYDVPITKKSKSELTNSDTQQEETEEKGMFHCQRDNSEPFVIVFETESAAHGFPYQCFQSVNIKLNGELEIEYMSGKVTITGKNIRAIFNAVNQKKANYIRTANRNELEKDYEIFIDDIQIKKYNIG